MMKRSGRPMDVVAVSAGSAGQVVDHLIEPLHEPREQVGQIGALGWGERTHQLADDLTPTDIDALVQAAASISGTHDDDPSVIDVGVAPGQIDLHEALHRPGRRG